MKAVVVMDSLKGSLSSMEAGEAAKAGILAANPEATVIVKPLADGGEGTTEALAYYLNDSYEYSVPAYNIGTCQIVNDTIIFANKLYKLINFDMKVGASSDWVPDN